MFARATQRAHGAFAQLFSLITSRFRRLLQHAFCFIQAFFDTIDELFFTIADAFLFHVSTPVKQLTATGLRYTGKPCTQRSGVLLPGSENAITCIAQPRNNIAVLIEM